MISSNDYTVRRIQPQDNRQIAGVIRTVLEEFGANKPGTVYFDDSTDNLSQLFATPKSAYYVAVHQDRVIGGAGIYPTDGLPPGTCELAKMYLVPEARGKGLGKRLINECLQFAKDQGFEKVYLETMPELRSALIVYEKTGFQYLPGPLGNSGHFGCSLWMLRDL
ncbi:MAG TPA: GNAT family N-acetyltransferase [Chitinophagaceae bacterium]|jgi:putative acetyltransferase|nr:GNAT family N-acetyltransferase [Chitinophagaceae bacterium]